MSPSFNTWTIIFFVASLQGLVLAGLLWRQKSFHSRFLSGVVFSFSIIMLFYVSFWTHYLNSLPRWVAICQGLTYVIGPLFHAYTLGRMPKRPYLHFLPVVLFVMYFFGWPHFSEEYRKVIVTVQVIIQAIHLLIYSLLSLYQSLKYGIKLKIMTSSLYTVYACSFPIYYVLVWTNTLRLEYDYMISMTASACIYFIGFSSFKQEDPYKKPTSKYDHSKLSDAAAQAVLHIIKKYMEREKGFLDSDLKLHQLADKLSISANHISQVVNEIEGCNFTDFVNRYRVEEAKRLMLDEQKAYKIIDVAYMSGFNNKATFNNAFKKFVGMQPSRFRSGASLS